MQKLLKADPYCKQAQKGAALMESAPNPAPGLAGAQQTHPFAYRTSHSTASPLLPSLRGVLTHPSSLPVATNPVKI